MHLICSVFRAVECRKPLLVAANSGISAWIDADGRIRAKCAKQQEDVLIARVELDSRWSAYLLIGDWPAGLCLMATVVMAIIGWLQNRRKKRL
jgi:apolipoprotein N-acyltransferase